MDRGEGGDANQVLLYAGLIILACVALSVAAFCAISRYCIARKLKAKSNDAEAQSGRDGGLSAAGATPTVGQKANLGDAMSSLLQSITTFKGSAETKELLLTTTSESSEPTDTTADEDPPESESDESEYGTDPASNLSMTMSTDSQGEVAQCFKTTAEEAPQLEYGLEYDRDSSLLIVSVIQARNLEDDLPSMSSDTFVKISCSGSCDPKKQTKACRGLANPRFAERHLFSLHQNDLTKSSVTLEVLTRDKYARQRLLGHVTTDLSTLELGVPVKIWSYLQDIDQEPPPSFAEVLLSLTYRPHVETVTIVAARIDNVRWMTSSKCMTGDIFLAISLVDGSARETKKTRVKRCSTQAVFNEAAVFKMPTSSIPTAHVDIEAKQLHADGSYSLLGACRLSARATDSELAHWNGAMGGGRKLPPMWHKLLAPSGRRSHDRQD